MSETTPPPFEDLAAKIVTDLRETMTDVDDEDAPDYVLDADECKAAVMRHMRAVRRAAIEECAQMIDCGCDARAAVLAAKTKADRWRACGEARCGALEAADMRALLAEEPSPPAQHRSESD